MPVLTRRAWGRTEPAAGERSLVSAFSGDFVPERALSPAVRSYPIAARAGIFTTCANPGCSSGWLKLFRPLSADIRRGMVLLGCLREDNGGGGARARDGCAQ